MRIFITGGTGFVGKHLIPRLLRGGHKILVFSKDSPGKSIEAYRRKKEKLTFLKGDIKRIDKHIRQLKRFRPEVAIHLAWQGIPSDKADLNIGNLTGGLEVVRAAIKAGSRAIIITGSCHEYGEPSGCVSENSPLRPYNTLYAAKTALYWLGAKLAAEHKRIFIWARPSFIYGPGQRSGALIPFVVNSLRRNRKPKIKNPYGGNDFVYVDDVAEALAMMAKKYRKIGSNVYNIGSGQLTPVAEVVGRIYREMGLTPPSFITRISRQKPEGFWLDISKAKRELRWRPRTDTKTGIKETVEFYKNISRI